MQKHILAIGLSFSLATGTFSLSLPDLKISQEEEPPDIAASQGEMLIVQNNSILPLSYHSASLESPKKILVVITAYSSLPEQTDDTPFITASGTTVKKGTVAANFLPLGTKIKIPSLYNDRIFTVEDRMHPRKGYQVDIWFSDHTEALEFGAKTTTIEVL